MVDKLYRRKIMKIESVALPSVQTTPIEEMPVINAEQIRSILYLGIRGNVRPAANAEHTVDTYA
ncbi:MAG: hypothetical protein A2177_13135 [Spirochaetes bacterium RBG_13_68_11]|jgi:hypothetical protein|nr:MAG: hypothetical protein A2177_13135 [Spirochaetes bacterium RBG_13_68_11]